MKATELMVGDYVRIMHTQKIAMVREIKQGCIYTNDNGYEYNEIEPISLTSEILEKNGFKRDAFTNLSPDFFYEDDVCSIFINLNSTCDKHKSIWVTNKNLTITASIEESRHALPKKPLLLHQLQHILKLCEIEKEIKL